jgi:hypothetical protein
MEKGRTEKAHSSRWEIKINSSSSTVNINAK